MWVKFLGDLPKEMWRAKLASVPRGGKVSKRLNKEGRVEETPQDSVMTMDR